MLKLNYIDTIKYEAGTPKVMFLLADIPAMKSLPVAIFGTGLEAYFVYGYLQKAGIKITHFLNNDSVMWGRQFCGKQIVSLDEIDRDYYIVIAMTLPRYDNEVLWQLKVHGYDHLGLAFMETYHTFGAGSRMAELNEVILKEINRILCDGRTFEEVIKPVYNVGPAGSLLGHIQELCWTTTWSDCLLGWFYMQCRAGTERMTSMLEIGPGMGLFSATAHQINPGIKIQWLMFDMDEVSEKSVKDKSSNYPANQFEAYYGMIEKPDFHIEEKFDIIVMTEVLEHFVNNPIPTMKKIAGMMKEGGRLYLSTPDWGHLRIYRDYSEMPEYTTLEKYKDGYIGHSYQYDKKELEEILNACDLVVEKYALSTSRNHNLIAKHR